VEWPSPLSWSPKALLDKDVGHRYGRIWEKGGPSSLPLPSVIQ